MTPSSWRWGWHPGSEAEIRGSIEQIYQLSPQQQGMLFETLSAPESGIFVEQEAHELQGDLNLDAFVGAWQRVVDRHEILRTGFVWKEQDEPLQVVLRRVVAGVHEHDIRGLSRREQEERIDTYLAEQQRHGFALEKPPLFRLALFGPASGAGGSFGRSTTS